MLIDSHVNLHGEKFADDLDAVIMRAKEAGVTGMLNICCNIDDMDAVLAIADHGPNIWASVGVHPHDAKDHQDLNVETLLEWAKHPKVVGIGETGLDFHYSYSDEAAQRKNFETHVKAAQISQLPLIIHTREADEMMLDYLETSMADTPYPALLHCYTSGPDLAARAEELGCYFSVSGIVTFKSAHDVRSVIENMPDDRIMIETDCPYLAPVPYRGRRNEPAFVREVNQSLAMLKGWSETETAERTTDAFFRLFQKAKPSWD